MALRAMSLSPSGSIVMPSAAQMVSSLATTLDWEMRLKSKRWQRDMIVGNTLCISVVASTKITWGGGSSSVLSRALEALLLSIWTSSMI
ncbi:hypothetical protein ES708_34883 [subsurface metagenome]